MSYQVLARKWRPSNFSEMVGQEHVLQALTNALNSQRLHHAYLFSGTRGVGKTTIARILAKCLNCEKGISAEPCGVCSACTEISEGRFVDLIEVDAASRTKVDDTRELLDNVQYTPTRARFKIYLIDEVHMLTKQSFNALLKTLEEPPEHVKFLLATTDPQKLPVTVLSRCLQFNLKHLDNDLIHKHLKYILQEEKVEAEDQGVWQLADAADGSLRDALSLTDQAIAFGNGKIKSEEISAMLGTVAPDSTYHLVLALSEQDGKKLLETIQQLSECNPDYISALDALLTLLHQIAVYQAVPESISPDSINQQKIISLANKLAAEDIQLFYQIGVNSKADFNFAPTPRSAFEMCLLRMLAFKPQGIPQLPEQILGDQTKKSEPTPVASDIPKAENNTKPDSSTPTENRNTTSERTITPASRKILPTQTETGMPDIATTTSDSRVAKHKLPDSNESWLQFFEKLPLSGMTMNIAANCIFKEAEENQLSLILDVNQAALLNSSHSERIAKNISQYLGKKIKVTIDVAHLHLESPGIRQQRLDSKRQQEAQNLFENDPFVMEIVSRFSGTINKSSIEAID